MSDMKTLHSIRFQYVSLLAILISLTLPQISHAQRAVLLDETTGMPQKIKTNLPEIEDEEESFETASELREKRRVAAGVLTAGQLGLLGAIVELNYSSQHAAVIGFGGGPRYNSLLLQYKYHFGGRNLTPYATFGYARWYNSTRQDKAFRSSTPGFLASKYLTEEERASGIFGKDFLVPSLGVQYTQLFGKAVGTSVYAEIMMLLGTTQFDQAPTGALGFLFYF